MKCSAQMLVSPIDVGLETHTLLVKVIGSLSILHVKHQYLKVNPAETTPKTVAAR